LGDDLVAPLVHLADAFIADKKLVVRSWVREHCLHLVTPLTADRTAAGVVWSNRSGFGTAVGDKLKLFAELVALARHLHEPFDQFLVLLLRRLRLFILRQPLGPHRPADRSSLARLWRRMYSR
jgi:hypothetical protein